MKIATQICLSLTGLAALAVSSLSVVADELNDDDTTPTTG